MYVDLHVHLRGTITPTTAHKLAQRNGIVLPDGLLDTPRFGWRDFSSFLLAYDQVTSVVVTASDLEEIAYCHLCAAAADGVGYLEFMLSTPHESRSTAPYIDQVAAIDAAADRALDETGIECRIIATAVRHLGPAAAVEAARTAVTTKSSRLVGFGLTGDERQFDIKLFREAFAMARSEGMKTTAHAGEHLSAETIVEAIAILGLDRVGHGVSAASSPVVTKELASAGIPLEICITSNLALAGYPDIASHPIGRLAEAGCVITLGTDDPSFLDTCCSGEYALANIIHPELLTPNRISRNAIDAAFCDDKTKTRLRALIEP